MTKAMPAILKVTNLTKTFSYRSGLFTKVDVLAVKPFSFSLNTGETLAIIGENGSGKSTLAKMLVGMLEPTAGDIWIDNHKLYYGDYRYRSQQIRMIFQNANNSFNPKQRIGQLLDAPLKLNTTLTEQEREKQIINTLKQVGLRPNYIHYYPTTLAAGQKQRVAIARALILKPKIIIVDEALTALDISLRSQMINLLLTLQDKYKISYIYISQDLGIIKHISDKIMVMQNGEVVEYGNTAEVLSSPLSPVTYKFINSYFGETLSADVWRHYGITKP